MIAAPTRRSRRANARARRRGQSPWTGATARHLRVAQDAAGLTTSTYDGDNLRRKIVSGSVTTTFVWDGSDYLQIKPSTGDATLLIALEGEVVGHVKGSEKRDYIVDPLGSVVAYLNSSQALTDQFEYWPYGELITEVETEVQPFLWVGSLGYFRDSDLRTYIRAREYRQDLGSWMQLDPLWPNESSYQYGPPVDTVDYLGLQRTQTNVQTRPPRSVRLDDLPLPHDRGVDGRGSESAGGIGAGALGIIIVGGVALIDLGRYICTGKTGPITGIGDKWGRDLFPDPPEEPPKCPPLPSLPTCPGDRERHIINDKRGHQWVENGLPGDLETLKRTCLAPIAAEKAGYPKFSNGVFVGCKYIGNCNGKSVRVDTFVGPPPCLVDAYMIYR